MCPSFHNPLGLPIPNPHQFLMDNLPIDNLLYWTISDSYFGHFTYRQITIIQYPIGQFSNRKEVRIVYKRKILEHTIT